MKNHRKGDFLSRRVQYIPLERLRPNPQQPRRHFDETALRELADSIRAYGILQPLTVPTVDARGILRFGHALAPYCRR